MDEIGSAAILAPMRSASVASEVNFRKCVTCMPPPSANKAALSSFETQRRDHQKANFSIMGYKNIT